MNNSDETLKKSSENDAVLKAIAELSKAVAEISWFKLPAIKINLLKTNL